MIMQKRNKFLLAGCVSVLLVASVVAFTVTFGEAKLVRPRLAEAIAATAPCQNAVSEAFANLGTTAPAFSEINGGAKVSDKHAHVHVRSDGSIELTAQGFGQQEVDGHMLLLVPHHDEQTPKDARLAAHRSSVARWVCRSESFKGIPLRYLPKYCS